MPIVISTNTSVNSLGHTDVILGGNLSDDNGETISALGVCVSTATNPTITDTVVATKGALATGAYICEDATGLTPGVTYHYRAYTTGNVSGTVYGSDQTFTCQKYLKLSRAPRFRGNPYKNITSITINSIQSSRDPIIDSNYTPCFVQYSGSDVTAVGTSRPYEDLEFRWTLEKSDGVGGWLAYDMGTFVSPIDGSTVDPATDQVGPEAFFRLGDANTYRVTLTVRGGPSGTATATATSTITVLDFDSLSPTTKYFGAAATGLGDGSDADNLGDESLLRSTLATGANYPLKVLIKSGDKIQLTASVLPNTSATRLRIDKFGGSALPILVGPASGAETIGWLSGGWVDYATYPDGKYRDVVVSNVEVATGNASNIFGIRALDGGYRHHYYDNCRIRSRCRLEWSGYNGSEPRQTTLQCSGVWGGSFIVPQVGDHILAVMTPTGNWAAILGATVQSNATVGTTLEHHIYPKLRLHQLFRWLEFRLPVEAVNYSVNGDSDSLTVVGQNKWIVFSECRFQGGTHGLDFSNVNNSGNTYQPISDVLVDRCVADATGPLIASFGPVTGTARHNISRNNTNTNQIFHIRSGVNDIPIRQNWQMYDNLIHVPSALAANVPIVLESNKCYDGSLQFRNNRIIDARSGSAYLYRYYTTIGQVEWDCNHNRVSPTGTPVVYTEGVGQQSISTWQGVGQDVDTGFAVPVGELDASNGDYRQSSFSTAVGR